MNNSISINNNGVSVNDNGEVVILKVDVKGICDGKGEGCSYYIRMGRI